MSKKSRVKETKTETASTVDTLVMPWNLFANGKFYINQPSGNRPVKLCGAYIKGGKWYLQWENLTNQLVSTHEDKCTLIARPISEMSDDEILNFMGVGEGVPHEEKCRALWCASGNIEKDATKKVDLFLYLLSIGVYPFDQSHFEAGEVIAKEA